MKTRINPRQRSDASYALLVALVFVGVSLLLLASLLQWTSGNTLVTDRNNAYNRAVGAAEAATEMVLSRMARDFRNQTFAPANVSVYRSLIPTNGWAAEYDFSDGAGGEDQTWVYSSPTRVVTNLDSRFTGLYGWVYVCRARSNVRLPSTVYPDFAVGVRQDFQLASIPIFQFAVYHAMDLEINPRLELVLTGKIHGNRNIYASPDYRLEFADAVGAVGKIYHYRHPDDPSPSSGILPTYNSLRQERVSSLSLPIGTNSNPAALSQILDPPPSGENPATILGRQRYYNKADLIVTTTDTGLSVKFNLTGDGTSFAVIPNGQLVTDTAYTFLKTNISFYDYREGKQVLATEIDMGRFNAWMTTNAYAASLVSQRGRALNSIYVDDQRVPPGRLVSVCVTNARVLPPDGFTLVTARPLYVRGHFNAPNVAVGSTDTSATKPASLVGDSVTILSDAWRDSYTDKTTLLDRDAANTTVNAAILAGIVPTTNSGGIKRYSGGVENFMRFLENWWGDGNYASFTFNGSMVALFPSRYATSFWKDPGTANNVYNPPTRRWAFDANFLDWRKLPPGTPNVQKLVRGRWQVIAAGSPN